MGVLVTSILNALKVAESIQKSSVLKHLSNFSVSEALRLAQSSVDFSGTARSSAIVELGFQTTCVSSNLAHFSFFPFDESADSFSDVLKSKFIDSNSSNSVSVSQINVHLSSQVVDSIIFERLVLRDLDLKTAISEVLL